GAVVAVVGYRVVVAVGEHVRVEQVHRARERIVREAADDAVVVAQPAGLVLLERHAGRIWQQRSGQPVPGLPQGGVGPGAGGRTAVGDGVGDEEDDARGVDAGRHGAATGALDDAAAGDGAHRPAAAEGDDALPVHARPLGRDRRDGIGIVGQLPASDEAV